MNQKNHHLKRIGLFVFILALVLSVVEIKARKMYRTRTDLYLKHQSFDKVKKDVEVLIIGSSSVETGLNPQYFDMKTFNLAFNAEDVYYNYSVLKKYEDQMPKLKIIVFGLTSVAFDFIEENFLPHLAKDYFWDLDIYPQSKRIDKILLNSLIFKIHQHTFIPDLVLYGKMPRAINYINEDNVPQEFFEQHVEGLLRNGFRAYGYNDISEIKLENHANSQVDLFLSYVTKDKHIIQQENKEYIEKIIKIAQNKNIKIILVRTPTSVYFRNKLPQDYADLFLENIKSILDKYPEVKFYDFSNYDSLINIKDFLNSNHLNCLGAKKMSIMLNSILSKGLDDKIVTARSFFKMSNSQKKH